MEPIIEIRGVGKKYNIHHQRGGYVALRDVLANVAKRPFAFLKQKTKRIMGIETQEDFWALRDVNINIAKGEVVGIIGANGAGKSTLLKILTGITPPTEGEIVMRGRVASLLEVGTGFHPELTGRENIFLNGAILGMTGKEIARKFDEIVAFAGVEQFLDTPVKHYSSGMYVRLAFSVAAHMEPDILLVDEVLAVGDAQFQKKSLGKMEEVTQREGRTILFVSHNLTLVQNICKKVVWLEHGSVKMIGNTKEVIDAYTQNKSTVVRKSPDRLSLTNGNKTGNIVFTDILIADADGSALIKSDSRLRIALKYTSDFENPIPDVRILISITSDRSQHMALRLDSHVAMHTLGESLEPNGEIVCETEAINLVEGTYTVEIMILPQKTRIRLQMMSNFEVVTDLSNYEYQRTADNTICDHLVKFHFSQ